MVTELQFADDAAVVVRTRESLEKATNVLVRVASEWGLTVSMKKTEFMLVGEHSEAEASPITLLGQSQTINNVKERILKASKRFGALLEVCLKIAI